MTIFTVRTFEGTHTELGVGQGDHTIACRAYGNYQPPYEDCTCGADSWFVFDRQPNEAWYLHCGPYATRGEAEAWILGIREV